VSPCREWSSIAKGRTQEIAAEGTIGTAKGTVDKAIDRARAGCRVRADCGKEKKRYKGSMAAGNIGSAEGRIVEGES